MGGPSQEIIQGITPGTGDHDHPAAGIERKHLQILSRILPAGVVDEVAGVNLIKKGIMSPLTEGGAGRGVGYHECMKTLNMGVCQVSNCDDCVIHPIHYELHAQSNNICNADLLRDGWNNKVSLHAGLVSRSVLKTGMVCRNLLLPTGEEIF